MKPPFDWFTRLPRWLFCAVCALAVLLPSAPAVANDNQGDLEALLLKLQSAQFADRHLATEQVIQQGATALPRLARFYFDAPPESVYRIRKILEGIVGSSNDEETYLRAISLLLALYSNGGDQMDERIATLKEDWRQRRRASALNAIVATGAVVKPFDNRQPLVRTVIRAARPESGRKAAAPEKPPVLSEQQQQELVESILANSADENRAFIFSALPSAPGQTVERQIRVVQRRLSIAFPDDWDADIQLIRRLSEIEDPLAVAFKRSTFTPQHWKVFKENTDVFALTLDGIALPKNASDAFPEKLQTLTLENYKLEADFCRSLNGCRALVGLKFDNCQFSDSVVAAINQLARISTLPVVFKGVALDRETVLSLAKLNQLRSMTLDEVTVGGDVVDAIEQLDQLNILELKSMTAGKELLQSVAKIARLSKVVLRGCKFDIEALKKIETNSRRVEFQPSAFLGVGPMGAEGPSSCKIGFVSPNSAAANGGIKVGDLLLEIDGHSVATFEEVRMRIAQFDPHQKMGIKLRRNDQVVDVEVELGANPQSN